MFVALVVCATYAFSLDRDVGFWDTGELQTVPYILGLMHPTGFPAEILGGWAFTHVFALGEPALRMNVFCMLCVVFAAACNCALAQLWRVPALVAAGAALCFAFTPVVWAHATHADVTDPALALCAAVLLATVFAIERDALRALYLASFLAGLALGTHGMVVWFLPVPLLLVLVARKPALLRAVPLCSVLAVLTAALLYAYLPVRSAMVTAANLEPTRALGLGRGMPFIDMGHPSTPSGFLDIVTGRTVDAPGSLPAIFDVTRFGHDAAFALAQLQANYPLPLLLGLVALAVFGSWGSLQRSLLFLPGALVTPFAASFANESDVSRYYTFPLLCGWVLVAVGLARLVALAPRYAPDLSRAAAAALVVLTAGEAYGGRALFEQRNDALGSTYIADVLGATEPNAIVASAWIYATPLAYASFVRHAAAQRVVVARPAEELISVLPAWTAERPVYAIAESPPQVPVAVVFVRALGVNPGPHDPKLYRLGKP